MEVLQGLIYIQTTAIFQLLIKIMAAAVNPSFWLVLNQSS